MIYVLGGQGFVGSAYIRYFQDLGVSVVSISRENYEDLAGSECDILINANGNSKKYLSKDDPKVDFLQSVVSVRNSLVDFKFKKYVYLSTADVYSDPSLEGRTDESAIFSFDQQSPYGFHKYLAELCVQHSARDWLIVRQGGFVGPGLKKNAVYDVLTSDKLWVNPFSQFQFISTDESARLVMELVDKKISNEIFNLTSKGTISVLEIMNLANRYLPYTKNEDPVISNISIDKVSRYLELPSTQDTIKYFLMERVQT